MSETTGGEQVGRGDVPPRGNAEFLRSAPVDDLWLSIEQSDCRAIVGLKAPQQPRGIWLGDWLVAHDDVAVARRGIESLDGVDVIGEFDSVPALEVRVRSVDALRELRGHEHLDYVHPVRMRAVATTDEIATSAGSSGCQGWDKPWGGVVYGGPYDRYPPGDFAPLSYRYSHVPEAWAAGVTGAGSTVAVLDTGVFWEQLQLFSRKQRAGGQFDAGAVQNRFATHVRLIDAKWDVCNHGTRMAGLVAGPRDGQGIVGVAYGSNLVSVKIGNDVVTDGVEATAVAKGIDRAANEGARIMALAFGLIWGDSDEAHVVGDTIRRWHYHPDSRRRVLFVAAAGTSFCPPGGLFPAKMDEVVAATGLGARGYLDANSCGYPYVDVGAVVQYGCSTGKYSDVPITFSGSSMATAIVTGVCALIWSKFPNASRDEVIERLYRSAAVYPGRDPEIGHGLVNAAKAVGAKDKDKEKDVEKPDDKLGPKEHDKLGPKEHDGFAPPFDESFGTEAFTTSVELERMPARRPFIRPEERPTPGDS